MMSRRLWLLFLPAVLIASSPCRLLAVQADGNEEAKAAIQKNAEACVQAFDKGDAGALAALFTEEGDFTDDTGRHLKGREAIEKAFAKVFADNKDLKLRIDSDSLKFVSPDVAIEDGVSSVIAPDGSPPTRARFTNVHVKKDGKWLLSSVREAPYAPPTNSEHLRDLEYLVGEWADESAKGEVARIEFDWAANQSFLVASFTTTFKNMSLGGGTQWIGWDPNAKTIRSWTFDTNGGFGEGTWSKDGDKWIIKTSSVLADGKKVTATNIATRADDDTLTWKSTERTLDGKPAGDISEIKLKRVK
jgi:uncharacterized protein (TIGR02246 family)